MNAYPVYLGMDFKVTRWLLLLAVAIVQVGCATTKETTDDTTLPLEAVPSQDDSHGWGTNIQSAGH